MAKLVAHPACHEQFSGFKSRHLPKKQNGRHKQRSGQHALARKKRRNEEEYLDPFHIQKHRGVAGLKYTRTRPPEPAISLTLLSVSLSQNHWRTERESRNVKQEFFIV